MDEARKVCWVCVIDVSNDTAVVHFVISLKYRTSENARRQVRTKWRSIASVYARHEKDITQMSKMLDVSFFHRNNFWI